MNMLKEFRYQFCSVYAKSAGWANEWESALRPYCVLLQRHPRKRRIQFQHPSAPMNTPRRRPLRTILNHQSMRYSRNHKKSRSKLNPIRHRAPEPLQLTKHQKITFSSSPLNEKSQMKSFTTNSRRSIWPKESKGDTGDNVGFGAKGGQNVTKNETNDTTEISFFW